MKCICLFLIICLLSSVLSTTRNHNKKSKKGLSTWKPDTIRSEDKQGFQLESDNGKYVARIQDDGNFVVYSMKDKDNVKNAIWNSGTNGKGKGPYRVTMQEDGNLVVYDSTNAALWNSQTNGKGTPDYKLIMQDDGNLVVYDKTGKATWNSGTAGKQKRRRRLF